MLRSSDYFPYVPKLVLTIFGTYSKLCLPHVPTTLTDNQMDVKRRKRFIWVFENRGILAGIARELECSPSMVKEVFHGRRASRGRKIEAKLAEAGAPGFAQFAESKKKSA
jgi:hypothetical protein